MAHTSINPDFIFLLKIDESRGGDKKEVFNMLRERLEKYQKYMGQHPEFYASKKFKVELPASFAAIKNLYIYFVPFYRVLNINIDFICVSGLDTTSTSIQNFCKLQHFCVNVTFSSDLIKVGHRN